MMWLVGGATSTGWCVDGTRSGEKYSHAHGRGAGAFFRFDVVMSWDVWFVFLATIPRCPE